MLYSPEFKSAFLNYFNENALPCFTISEIVLKLNTHIQVWEMASGALLCSMYFESAISAVAVDNAESRLFAGSITGNIYLVDLFAQVSESSLPYIIHDICYAYDVCMMLLHFSQYVWKSI